MDKAIRYIVDFVAKTLHVVINNKVSHDRAFQQVLREYRKAANYVPLKVLYKVSRDVIIDYYMLRYAEATVYGKRGSAKRMVRLWLILKGAEKEYLANYSEGVERLRRRLLRTLPRRIESVDELLEGIENESKLLAIKYSFPKWFVDVFLKLLPLKDVEKLLSELNEEKWWIRVNTLRIDVDTVAERLLEKGVVVKRDTDLPYMLKVVDYNEPLHHLEEMWRGEIVFQDKASALVVEALEPSEGDMILDMAAAPGIKDSLIMQLTKNKATIIAIDVSRERIKRTQRVLRLLGVDLSKIQLVNADSTYFYLSRKPSKIILDAPCTSSGAMGKDPAIKVHLESINWVAQFPQIQARMLRSAMRHDVEIVYATCSILPFEGEEIVEDYSEALETPRIPGSPGYAPYTVSSRVKRLFPHLHDTQGFFIAKLIPR